MSVRINIEPRLSPSDTLLLYNTIGSSFPPLPTYTVPTYTRTHPSNEVKVLMPTEDGGAGKLS